jgi:hypothetical protein
MGWQYHEPGEPVAMNVPAGETIYHAELFFAELERPIHMDVSAVDQEQARERVIVECRKLIAGVTHPPTVAIHTLEEWARR